MWARIVSIVFPIAGIAPILDKQNGEKMAIIVLVCGIAFFAIIALFQRIFNLAERSFYKKYYLIGFVFLVCFGAICFLGNDAQLFLFYFVLCWLFFPFAVLPRQESTKGVLRKILRFVMTPILFVLSIPFGIWNIFAYKKPINPTQKSNTTNKKK
ncbi:hypothetical protein [Helicobacter sp. T3_23-1056]